MPTALIADDEPHLAEDLRRQLARVWPELAVIAVAANGPQAAELIALHRPDIAFLDIRMPGATGLDVAQQLARAEHRPRVVFVTAYDQYALQAFESEAADYLLKPVGEERLRRSADKLRAALAARQPVPPLDDLLAALAARLPASAPPYLRWIRAGRRGTDGELTEQIAVDDIVYIQADDKYTCVHVRDGAALREYLIRVPLTDLARDLDPADFAQIHRSVIVNLREVAGTRRDAAGKLHVRLRGHARELPVSRQYVHLFRQM
jgi:DNA-binding LytR/AlgR family response regulator